MRFKLSVCCYRVWSKHFKKPNILVMRSLVDINMGNSNKRERSQEGSQTGKNQEINDLLGVWDTLFLSTYRGDSTGAQDGVKLGQTYPSFSTAIQQQPNAECYLNCQNTIMWGQKLGKKKKKPSPDLYPGAAHQVEWSCYASFLAGGMLLLREVYGEVRGSEDVGMALDQFCRSVCTTSTFLPSQSSWLGSQR